MTAPAEEKVEKAPECKYDVHGLCHGNLNMTVEGVVYHRKRCGCPCHPKGLRTVRWEDTLNQ